MAWRSPQEMLRDFFEEFTDNPSEGFLDECFGEYSHEILKIIPTKFFEGYPK